MLYLQQEVKVNLWNSVRYPAVDIPGSHLLSLTQAPAPTSSADSPPTPPRMARSRAIEIEGLGTCTANIGLDGSFDLQYRADSALVNGLNVPGTFTGTIRNRENIGKTGDELIAQWNADNPTDLVVE